MCIKIIIFRSVFMSNKFELGTVLTGKVTGIQPYGAFVALDEETQGLVHISEMAGSYVKNPNDILSVGQVVDVQVISVDPVRGRISLRLINQ